MARMATKVQNKISLLRSLGQHQPRQMIVTSFADVQEVDAAIIIRSTVHCRRISYNTRSNRVL